MHINDLFSLFHFGTHTLQLGLEDKWLFLRENDFCDPGGRVNAQSQFTHGLFQAYYTVISRNL